MMENNLLANDKILINHYPNEYLSHLNYDVSEQWFVMVPFFNPLSFSNFSGISSLKKMNVSGKETINYFICVQEGESCIGTDSLGACLPRIA